MEKQLEQPKKARFDAKISKVQKEIFEYCRPDHEDFVRLRILLLPRGTSAC